MPNSSKFADLHCHTTIRVFHHFSRKNKNIFYRANAHPWTVIPSNKRPLKNGFRAKTYSQSDIDRLIKGKVKLAFATLYPLEQGYTYFEKEKRFRASVIASLILGIQISRLNYIEHEKYHYWEELTKEHTFICRRSGVFSTSQLLQDQEPEDVPESNYDDEDDHSDSGKEIFKPVSGTYWLIADNPEKAAEQIKANDRDYKGEMRYSFRSIEDLEYITERTNELVLILNLEGSHFLNLNKDSRLPNAKVSDEELGRRIDYIKQLDPPIFYITPAHHFDNTIISHARSIPEMGELLPEQRNKLHLKIIRWLVGNMDIKPSQSTNMNYLTDTANPHIGISEKGIEVLLKLLHLDKNLQTLPENGRRILIDIKHLSASSRKNFYERIINPFNESKTLLDKIPVIASHSAYAGVSTLNELIANYDHENNDAPPLVNGIPDYLKWNINLSDEDVQVICSSGGMIGLCFDQRVLGVPYNTFRDDFGIGRKNFERQISWGKLLAHQIKGLALAVKAKGMHQYKASGFSIWNVICIGTDFDGGIDPVNPYPTAVQFISFQKDLVTEMNEGWSRTEKEDFGLNDLQTIERVVNRICFDNVFEFVKKNFKKNYFHSFPNNA